MTVVKSILQLFEARGAAAYFGEAVSQSEHAFQAAHLAERAGADEALIVAALLHDIGHLLHGQSETIADANVDARHEMAADAWLRDRFGESIVAPIRMHVAAKRYLCAVESEYLAALSPASQQSLRLQGGPFGADEVRAFESDPHYERAVQLRRFDDQAKVPGLEVPGFDHYVAMLERAGQAARP